MDRRSALQLLSALDRLSRQAYAGDPALARKSVDLTIHGQADPDVLVAHITLGSTDRWLGDAVFSNEDLMEACLELMLACEKGDAPACRRWQKEVCQLRGPLLDRHGYMDPALDLGVDDVGASRPGAGARPSRRGAGSPPPGSV